MSGLTEEQKKRIAENRLKALQRLAISQNSSKKIIKNEASNRPPEPNIQPSGSRSSFPSKQPFLNNNESKLPSQNFYGAKKEKPSTDDLPQKIAFAKVVHHSTFQGSSSQNKAKEGFQSFSSRKLTGTFSLIAVDRFIADIPYHAQAIEIFKTIPSRSYDASNRNWNFHVSDHDKLFKALAPLRPEVCISPLPAYIHKALKKSASYPDPSRIDLICLDESLIEAFLPFQREGVCFGVSRNGRVLIADDMGLGKTIQALGIASYYRQDWPLLIVAPSSVRYSWAESIDRWVRSVDKDQVLVANSCKDDLEGEVLIISYDLMSRREKEIINIGFKTIILDESHMLKNFKSIRCKAAARIMKKCKRVIMLSGTPALSKPIELFTQVSGVDPQLFPLHQEFGIRYCAGKQLPWGWDYNGSSNMTELQILLENTVMIRRMKGDVISQLPSKQRMTVQLDPNLIKACSKSMKDAAQQYNNSSKSDKRSALLQFFNESAVAKHKAVCNYIKELIEQDRKFLVFAHHRFMLDKLSETCDEMKTSYIRIDGSVSSEERQALIDNFQNVSDTKVAILSITAANTGITLTAAQLVVFAELFWNPGALVQAENRVHRIGQVDSVLVQYLIGKGTVDDHIWPMIQNKLEVLNKVGLANDNFSEASTTNQKVKDNGILKYFENVQEIDDNDLLAAIERTEEEQTSQNKRSQECDDIESPLKRRKVKPESEEF